MTSVAIRCQHREEAAALIAPVEAEARRLLEQSREFNAASNLEVVGDRKSTRLNSSHRT